MICDKCGACCQYLKIKLEGINQDAKEWLLAHENILYSNGYLFFISKCKMLKDNGECGIYSARFDCCKLMNVSRKDCLEAKDIKNMIKVDKNG